MIGTAGVIQVFKYGFITMVVSCAGYLIASITVVKHLKGESIDDLVYKPQISPSADGAIPTLNKGFEKCLTQPSTPFCLMSAHKRLTLLRSKAVHDAQLKEAVNISSNTSHRHSHPITTVLRHFSRFARTVGVKPMLLEPSMLFCLLSPDNKVFLLTQELNPGQLQGSRKVVTVGITEEESKVLDQEEALKEALDFGFKRTRVSKLIKGSKFGKELSKPDDFYTVHYFFTRQSYVVHVVVFLKRKNYLWHEDIYEEYGIDDLLYVKPAAYDNFKAIPLETQKELDMEIYLPSNLLLFMLQIENSELHSCPMNASEVFQTHSFLTADQLQNRATVAIIELKAIFQPHYVSFWLWGKSLSGWYEKCNIFQDTKELNLAVYHDKLKRLSLSTTFTNNQYLKVVHHSSIDDKDAKFVLECYGLKINMFVSYEDGTSVHFYEDDAGNEQPNGLVYPKFKLCATDVFGQRIQVPCETGAIVKSLPLQN